MPQVVLFIATSLDAYIASSDGTVDWLLHDADYGYTEFMGLLDAVVMGRKTWEQAKTFEEVPFAGKQVFVFSRTLPSSSDERIHHVQGEVGAVVAAMRQSLQQDLWLVGGGELIRQFISHRLIDEFRLFVHAAPAGLSSGRSVRERSGLCREPAVASRRLNSENRAELLSTAEVSI